MSTKPPVAGEPAQYSWQPLDPELNEALTSRYRRVSAPALATVPEVTMSCDEQVSTLIAARAQMMRGC